MDTSISSSISAALSGDPVEVRELRKRLHELDKLVYRFSHDFKGPLDSIKGILQLFPEEQLDEAGQQYLNLIEQSSQKLTNVVLDMIDGISVIKRQPSIQAVSLPAIVTDALAMVQLYFPEDHGVVVSTEVEVETAFRSDPCLLQSVIQHLLINGVLYHRPQARPPWVKLHISREAATVKISIEDNGQGIAPEIQERIFDMFYRGNVQSKGTGLGLYVVRSAIEKLGGKLRMHSQPGRGTRFDIWIPEGS